MASFRILSNGTCPCDLNSLNFFNGVPWGSWGLGEVSGRFLEGISAFSKGFCKEFQETFKIPYKYFREVSKGFEKDFRAFNGIFKGWVSGGFQTSFKPLCQFKQSFLLNGSPTQAFLTIQLKNIFQWILLIPIVFSGNQNSRKLLWTNGFFGD